MPTKSDKHKTEISLDTTGQYLVVGRGSRRKTSAPDAERIQRRQYFAEHAFLFFDNAERILADPRMALASVDVGNGLAYTGTAAFQGATLGVYLEWWLSGCCPNTVDREGREALTFFISGSPLSGANSCSCVYRDGTIATIAHYPFPPVWRSFALVNRRYADVSREGAMSIEEVVEALTKDC